MAVRRPWVACLGLSLVWRALRLGPVQHLLASAVAWPGAWEAFGRARRLRRSPAARRSRVPPAVRRRPWGVGEARPQVSLAAAGPGGVLPNGEARDAYSLAVSVDAREGLIPQFASPIYRARLRRDREEVKALNDEIVVNFKRLQARDQEGLDWSEGNYAGGYTSYASLPALQKWVPPIQQLEEWLEPHVREFRKQAMLDDVPELFMTDCWANVMGEGTEHVFHQHNRSTVSGTYYVQTPRGCSGLLFEDPRLDRTVMRRQRRAVECPAVAGCVILFESWLRHTVPPNQASDGERISVSFNYHWRYEEPTVLG